LQSNLEDADYANVVTQYAVKQTVFNAALNSTARIMQLSLMDYIR
jgi:flagellin-like hook-associated protein FlgL